MPNRVVALVALLLLPLLAQANEDPLPFFWPHEDGLRFDYDYHFQDVVTGTMVDGQAFLAFEGNLTVPGITVQRLTGYHTPIGLRDEGPEPGFRRWLWLARPDLREAMRGEDDPAPFSWAPNFLHPGGFRITDSAIEMWQESWAHPTWTYLRTPVAPGMSFSHQLVPELADDIFLYGLVTGWNQTVSTPAGEFQALVVSYVIDFGESTVTDEQGEVIAVTHGVITGHVAYVPDVGPVQLREEFTPYVWADCGDRPCPPEIVEHLGDVVVTQTLALTQAPLAHETRTWSDVKAMFR